jgi:hypothetical protein
MFYYFKVKNKQMANLNKYLLSILVPFVVLVTAQKTISLSPDKYFLNESFLSWMILVIYLAFISPLSWQKSVGITALSFILFAVRLWSHYGIGKIRDDLYIHFVSVLLIICIIVRSKETLDRVQFQNLMIIKRQAKHWHQVLDQLSEGVLLIEPEAPNVLSSTVEQQKDGSDLNSSS